MKFKSYSYLYYYKSEYLNDIQNKKFNLSMMDASYNGHIEIVKLMLDHGANSFNTSMECASRNGHIEIVKLILDHGAVNSTKSNSRLLDASHPISFDFNTSMRSASYYGHIEIVKLMLDHGANSFNTSM